MELLRRKQFLVSLFNGLMAVDMVGIVSGIGFHVSWFVSLINWFGNINNF